MSKRPSLNRAQDQTPYKNPSFSRFDCKIGTVFIFCKNLTISFQEFI